MITSNIPNVVCAETYTTDFEYWLLRSELLWALEQMEVVR